MPSMQTIPHRRVKEKQHLFQTRLAESIFFKLRGAAGSRGMSAAALVRELIDKYVERTERTARRAS